MMKRSSALQPQTGAVLLFALIMLMLMTMIGLSGSKVTSLEQRMAGNFRDKDLAFQAAESTLQYAEAQLHASPMLLTFDSGGKNGYYSSTTTTYTTPSDCSFNKATANPGNCVVKDAFWTNWPTATYPNTASLTGLVSNPQYIIQVLYVTTGTPNVTYYQTTAYAQGATTSSVAILQSIIHIP
jgi:type IV pilus assembly protein PilX